MLTLPKASPSLADLSHRSSDMPHRREVERIVKNSMTTPAVLSSHHQNPNQEESINRKQAEKTAQNIKSILKHTMQQSNHLNMSSGFTQLIDANSQKAARGNKPLKRRTLGSEIQAEDEAKKSSRDGFITSRSIIQEHSLSKLNADYIEASLREEEEMFKRIEEKALMLKQKEKKGRQILKQIRKNKECIPQEASNVSASLSIIGPMKSPKSKLSHKRGQSCDLPLIDSQLTSEGLQNLERVNSQLQTESIALSDMEKSYDTFHFAPQLSEMHTQIDLLKEELSKQKQQLESRNGLIKSLEEKNDGLAAQLKQSAITLQKQQKIAYSLKQENAMLINTHKSQLEQLQFKCQQQILKKDLQIAQLASTLSNQTMKLRGLQAKCITLQQHLSKNNDDIQSLQKQGKTKNQEYQQAKRKLERDIAQMIEEKRKLEQAYLKEIQTLKTKAQQQIIEEKEREKLRMSEIAQREQRLKILSDQLKFKQAEISHRLNDQQLSYKKQREQLETLNLALKDEINRQNQAISKLTVAKQEIESTCKTLQLYLANAEDHIRKVQEKYHSANKELTEKNLSYDFLWIQLKEEEEKSKLLEDRLKRQQKQTHEQEAEPHRSIIQSSENESPMKQEEKGLNHILSSSTLKEIKDLHGMIEQASSNRNKCDLSEKEVKICLSHRPSLNLPLSLLTDSKCSNQVQEPQHQVVLEEVQSTSCNMLLKNDVSDAFSEENDQIFEMASNKNSNASKMESSVGAFSEYSRAKSTQSALSHNQMEKDYQNKMKNSKLLAKLGKLKAKK